MNNEQTYWLGHYDYKGEKSGFYVCLKCGKPSNEKYKFCPHCGRIAHEPISDREIVVCADCLYSSEAATNGEVLCDLLERKMLKDDFCSYGVKRVGTRL